MKSIRIKVYLEVQEDGFQLINYCFPVPEPNRQRPHDPCHNRLQDQALCLGPGHLALHPQRLLQRLVERPGLQTHERLPEIRLLPGNQA